MKLNHKGVTLVEMLIVMVIFIIVIMITGDSFNKILSVTNKLSGMEESNIEGVVGLEMFRHDLEQAGFGLPYEYDPDPLLAPVYVEATPALPKLLNDAPSGIPRAVAFQKDANSVDDSSTAYTGINGSWYVALKGTSMSRSAGAQKWTYATYSSTDYGSMPPKVWPGGNLTSGVDRVIVLKRTFTKTKFSNILAYNTGTPGSFWSVYSKDGFAPAFSPKNPSEIVYAYGLGQTNDSIGMPFNRADFFIARPSDTTKIPVSCASNTGILYKATVNQSDGKLNYLPLLDCVADMQVVLGWDLWNESSASEGQDGIIDTWSSPVDAAGTVTVSGSATTSIVQNALASPESIRNALKLIKVYVLAQIGKRDTNFTSDQKIIVAGKGELSLGREYTFTPEMRNYRWKVYSIVAHPKNLLTNQ